MDVKGMACPVRESEGYGIALWRCHGRKGILRDSEGCGVSARENKEGWRAGLGIQR